MSNQAITGIPIHRDTSGFNFAGREEYPSAKGEILYPHAVVLNQESGEYENGFDFETKGQMGGRSVGIRAPGRHAEIEDNVNKRDTFLGKAEAVLEGACLSRLFTGKTHLDPVTNVLKPNGCQWINLNSVKGYFANVATFSDKCGIAAAKGTHYLFDNSVTRTISPLIPLLAGLPVSAVAKFIGTVVGGGLQIASHVFAAVCVIVCVAIIVFGSIGLATVGGTLFLLTSPVIAYFNKNSFEIKELKGIIKGDRTDNYPEHIANDKKKRELAADLYGMHLAAQKHRNANYWFGDGTLFKIGNATHEHLVSELLKGDISGRDITAEYIAEKKALNMAVNLAAVGTVSLFPAAKQKVRDAALRVMEREGKLPSQIEKFSDEIIAEMEHNLPPKPSIQPPVLTTEDGRGDYERVELLDEDDDGFGDFESAPNSVQMTTFGEQGDSPRVVRQAAGNGQTNPLLRSTSTRYDDV